MIAGEEKPLSEGAIAAAAGTCASHCHIHVLEELDSTNSWLLEHGRPRQISLCIAERQIAGKGRRGRAWSSGGGEFTCSIRVSLQLPLAQAGAFSLVVALALREAISSLGVVGVGIKWPNDLLHEGRKLSGILLEVANSDEYSVDLVCGAGVNWKPLNQTVDQPLVDIHSLMPSSHHDRNVLAGRWLAILLDKKTHFERLGFESIAADWADADLMQNIPVTVTRGQQTIEGIALGVDHDGALILKTKHGKELMHAGEVSLRRR